jgi:hypothetical protein
MSRPKTLLIYLNGIVLAIILLHSIYRDIRLESEYPGDLRNRIVGARLQKDGRLPYHFHWRESDPVRYYNPNEVYPPLPVVKNASLTDVNEITASPFYHELLYPFCELPQRTISEIWLWGEYIMLFLIIGMFCLLTKDKILKWLLVNTGVLFLFTGAWKSLIYNGQIYLFFGFLITCIFFTLTRNKKYDVIIGSICAVVFVLSRPIGIVFFIPILFHYKNYLTFITISFSCFFLYFLFILITPFQRLLYKDYIESMKGQIQLHQFSDVNKNPPARTAFRRHDLLEGFDFTRADSMAISDPVRIYSENGNIFVLYYKLLHKKMSLTLMYASAVLAIFFLSSLFLLQNKKSPPSVIEILLFGFILYITVELFSPIYRHQYNTVQWFPLILAGLMLTNNWRTPVFILLWLGLFLNIVNFPWLPMRHTIGEYIWLISLLLLVFSKSIKNQYNKKNLQLL